MDVRGVAFFLIFFLAVNWKFFGWEIRGGGRFRYYLDIDWILSTGLKFDWFILGLVKIMEGVHNGDWLNNVPTTLSMMVLIAQLYGNNI